LLTNQQQKLAAELDDKVRRLLTVAKCKIKYNLKTTQMNRYNAIIRKKK